MAVYYKFHSEKYYKSICVDGLFITLAHLKHTIFQSRYSTNRGTDLDIEITNAQTNQEYRDEAMLIPKCTTLLVRRTPKHHRSRLIAADFNELKVESKDDTSTQTQTQTDVESLKLEDDFGPQVYAPLPNQTPSQPSNGVALASYLQINTGRGGRTIGGHGSGLAGYGWKKPPHGYVCHRCNEPGHFIQHCPTNRYPDGDIRFSSLPTSVVETVKLDESPVKNEVAIYSQGDLPPELKCVLCKEVMKDAVLTRKCCFNSYCDKCIRVHIISKSACVCGAKDILADDLIPNKTLRDTITRMLESSSSSRSSSQLQDKESASKGKETRKPADEEHLQKKVIMNAPTYNNAPLSNKRKREQRQPPATEQQSDMKKHVQEYESSNDDDDRNFKRKRSWYGPSLASPQVKEDCRQWRIVQA